MKILVEPHLKFQTAVTIALDVGGLVALREDLSDRQQPDRETVLRGHSENGDHWTFFFRMKEGETRLMVAHPEKTAWVVTASLSGVHFASLISGLSAGVDLTSFAPLHKFNNLALKISIE
nr:MetaGeneMark_Unknown Function [uncultured bacterium]